MVSAGSHVLAGIAETNWNLEPMNIDLPALSLPKEAVGYTVRVADDDHRRREVAELISQMYSWRGYEFDLAAGAAHRPAQTVLQVHRNKQLVGTLTLRMDSEHGLMAEQLYREEIDLFRGMGGRLCELTGLAVVPGEDSREVLGALFHSVWSIGCEQHGASDVFIEVNPRHVAYYQRRHGFRQVGPERICPRVGAPAVLLHLDLDDPVAVVRRSLDRRALPFTRRSY